MKSNLSTKGLVLLVPVLVVGTLLVLIALAHLLLPSWVGEQPGTAGYFQKAYGLVTDAPHATAELFYSTVENVAVLTVGYIWGKNALKRQHAMLDAEHGVEHEADGTVVHSCEEAESETFSSTEGATPDADPAWDAAFAEMERARATQSVPDPKVFRDLTKLVGGS